MSEVFAVWSPDFVVELLTLHLLPMVGAGFMIVGIFWLVGYVVNSMFRLIK